ncbi:Fic family protein [Marinomonas sp. IMCC 4694]|uniref:Fic family protein n=1 Tax=Marinomonas sp. IMCC 4694 TaxID=2605432 RepID=UPI0011E74468|nr:Fic family protein [Marinomonas sp. IMCC 4694]TYL46727.1 Fic family protein [Marinomonas sp. IMCC 4694]
MKYSWQHPDWPNFTLDETLCRDALYQYALEAGRLSGGMSQLENTLQYDAYIDLMVSEAINTSEIEGERLDREDVRSSIKNFLGLSNPPTRIADPRAEGMAALMVDVRNSFAGELTKATLFHWHQLVLPQPENSLLPRNLKVGQWRDSAEPMHIVSGPIGYEKVHYEAPPAYQVDTEINRFLNWFNRSNPLKAQRDIVLAGPVRSAIAHFWFETIHPFDDGNGRVGRAIAEMALAQDLNRPPLLSLSTIIEKDKNAYYDGLNKASQFNLDINDWVTWFVDSVLLAQQEAAQKIDFVLKKAKFWEKHQHTELNERQKKVLSKLFNAGSDGFEGGLSAKKYISITSSSKATATRDLSDLVEKECLYRLEGGGRNARYGLAI